MKAVIFDMDGVLVDSEPLHFKASQKVIAEYGKRHTWELHEEYIGMTEDAFWKDVVRKLGIEEDYTVLMDAKAKVHMHLLKTEAKEMDGAVALVKKLASQTKVAVASSSIHPEVETVLEKLGLRDVISVVVTGDDVIHSKPHPEIYLIAASQLGVDAADCVGVEDAVNGVEAVKTAGMKCVAITTSFDRDELSDADYVIDSFDEFDMGWME